MDEQNRNLILATVLSMVVIIGWMFLFPAPEQPLTDPNAPVVEETGTGTQSIAAAPRVATGSGEIVAQPELAEGEEAPRVDIDTARLEGSISLRGGRLDDLSLKDYRVTLEPDAPIVDMLRPVGSEAPYYALYGWAPGSGLTLDDVPGANTLWAVESGETLTTDSPVTLVWQSPAGLIFRRTISVDADYMFTIKQSVENGGEGTTSLAAYGVIARHGEPQDLRNFFILHEGVVGMADGELTETDYSDMPDFEVVASEGARAEVVQVQENGWIGFTDHYWMSTLIPAPGSAFKSVAKYDQARDIYQTEAVTPTVTLAPGQGTEVVTQLFAGAKEWEAIRTYQNNGIEGFLDSIDWGWFFFLTKPIFAVLHFINAWIGNMGWAIIGLTLLIKAILFPLAYRSYSSMAKMKELQPEMEKIKERVGDDRQKMQQAMMELYKKEKVNPASGCLPILLQIPIFFSLYKVIFVTLELRHAPWLGWITDLSAPDPSSILNLFGLLPYATPSPDSLFFIFSLGVLPIILGISMWLQQKLNPAPTDDTQRMIFAWMPWIFMFMLGSFASGLVLYWIANNLITFAQQYIIMRSQGYKPDILGNITSGFKRGDKKADKS